MAKFDNGLLDPDYVPVAARVARFYERYPEGRIVTRLVSRDERAVTFEARVYRSAAERRPAATGWASGREGDGDINTVACLENTETSAVGRALANLGILASRLRPSAEEMAKADRERARRVLPNDSQPGRRADERPLHAAGVPAVLTPAATLRMVRETRAVDEERQRRADVVREVLALLDRFPLFGARVARIDRIRRHLLADALSIAELERVERRARGWLRRRRGDFAQPVP